ncbi:hypothetical protein BDP81DRAFT_91051 [Colletotrichum phormii]|uniref:Uncharacterized protein n=1 Tax=Colletotrichum phormii TaxID=359342 RepID=A0AAJ0A5F5_9PEZI|nr:uncharacterized protein BDP81DRAFT_91051 [Colletotrichum phormii]KAK1654925.1 hypothetical protein BDP81DRAFT_91051 [Colletotrichum phormii]
MRYLAGPPTYYPLIPDGPKMTRRIVILRTSGTRAGGGGLASTAMRREAGCYCNCAAMRVAFFALDSAYTARPMAAEKSLDKATRRCHWASNPCRALVRIRGPLHRLGFWVLVLWPFGGNGVKKNEEGHPGGETDFCRHVELDVAAFFDNREGYHRDVPSWEDPGTSV